MKTENILVIGGNGKTGRRVAENLTQLGHNVRVVLDEKQIQRLIGKIQKLMTQL